MGHHYQQSCEDLMRLLHDYAMREASLADVEGKVRNDWKITRPVADRLLKVAIELRQIHAETDCF